MQHHGKRISARIFCLNVKYLERMKIHCLAIPVSRPIFISVFKYLIHITTASTVHLEFFIHACLPTASLFSQICAETRLSREYIKLFKTE
jgi:hypothetical protein